MSKLSHILLISALSGCASLEKIHQFQVDQSDTKSRSYMACETTGKWRDPIKVGLHQFYVAAQSSPHWIGLFFIPLYPLDLRYNEIRLNFGSEVPTNPEQWSIKFDSDGYVAHGEVVSLSEDLKPFQIKFKFPSRTRADNFQVNVPDGSGVKSIKILENSNWKYYPIFLPMGDSFPRWQDCR